MRKLWKKVIGRSRPTAAARTTPGPEPDCQGVAGQPEATLPQRCSTPTSDQGTLSGAATPWSPGDAGTQRRSSASGVDGIAQPELVQRNVKRTPPVCRHHAPRARLPADVHAMEFRDWLGEHGWQGRAELYGCEIEAAYSDFCTETWIEARPWRAVAPHFNRLLQHPGAPRKPTVSHRDPTTGLRRRVRVYRIPTSAAQLDGRRNGDRHER